MKIRILASSDIHGYIMPYQYSDLKPCNHGFWKLKETISEYENEYTIKIDNGDILEGSPILTYYYNHERDNGHIMADMLNEASYDYINVGNHDFNYGVSNLQNYIKASKAKCILGNIKYNGEYIGCEYIIHRFDDTHAIAIIGVCTHYITNWEKPENLVGLEIEEAFDYVQKTVKRIKDKEDVQGIVVVYHGGFEKDLDTGVPTEVLTGENEGYRMCDELDGVDLIVSGHQHRSIAQECCGVYVTQTAYRAGELAVIDWDLDSHEISGSIIPSTMDVKGELLESIDELEKKTQVWLDEKLGEVMNYDLRVNDRFKARLHKHPVVSFLNQVQLDATGAMLSGNALFNEAVGFNKEITMRDIVSTYVYPNTTVVLEVSGKVLKEYLEQNAKYFAIANDEIVVNPVFISPKPQHFNYDMVDGVDYTIKVSNPEGQRIVELKVGDRSVEDDDIFSLAINNYRASGGGNFMMFKDCKIVKEIQVDMVTLIGEYLQKNPKLYVNHKDNIKVIK